MDFSKILPVVEAAAPTIAGLLGGPLASMGVQALEGVFGLAPGSGSDPATLQRAVAQMTPETAIKLAEIDADLKAKLVQANIDLEKIGAEDRDSARKMQAATNDWTPRLLAVLLTAGFFAVLAYMMRYGIPKDGGGEALLVMLGALGSAFGAVVSFYYGSSAGSAKKDDTLARAVK